MTTKEYNACVSEFADDLFRYATRLVRDSNIGQDVIQDVFEKIWRKKTEIRMKDARSYLFRSVHNGCMDMIRKNNVKKQYADSIGNKMQVHYSESRFEMQDFINRALNELPETQRSLILLRDYEGYSYQEIGEITGLTESQVKVYIFRGRKTLKSIIQKVTYDG